MRIVLWLFLFTAALFADVLSELENFAQGRFAADVVVSDYKCGFRQNVQLQLFAHRLAPDLQKLAAQSLNPPSRQYQITSPSGHFVLHYDLDGYHAVSAFDSLGNGIPDYIDSAAAILDHVWQVEIEEMGFNPPPDMDGKPVQAYHVYFTNFALYGLTSFDLNADIPSLPGQNYTSYLELHINYKSSQFATHGLEALKVTAAHEFHHAIQIGYQFRWDYNNGFPQYPDLFFLEMTSTFMEDYVYDSINDYVQYVNRFIPNVQAKAFNDADGNTEYANALYLKMLVKQYGIKILRQIWEEIVRHQARSALDITLQKYGRSFAWSLSDYAGWLYFTGNRADPLNYFEEGALYRELILPNNTSGLDQPLQALHIRYAQTIVQKNAYYQSKVQSSSSEGQMSHIVNQQTVLKPVPFNKRQIFAQSSAFPLVIVLTNPDTFNIDDVQYSLNMAPVQADRNPVTVKTEGDLVTFVNVPEKSRVLIFNVLGQLIKELNLETTGAVQWDLRNQNGRSVPSGIYFFLVKAPQFQKAGKITVLR